MPARQNFIAMTGCAIAVVAGLLLAPRPAWSVVSLDFLPIDNLAHLSGHTTYDIQAGTDTDWTAGAILFRPTSGSIYQHPLGFDALPIAGLIQQLYPQQPAIAYDTHMIGTIAGGAGDLGGGTVSAFDTGGLDVTWFNTTDGDIGTTTIGRLTLTDDTAGTMSVLLAGGEDPALFEVAFSPGLSPIVTQVVQQEEDDRRMLYEAWEPYWQWPNDPFTTPVRHGYSQENEPRRQDFDDLRRVNLNKPNSYRVDPVNETEPNDNLPEPASAALVGVGLCAAVMRRRVRPTV